MDERLELVRSRIADVPDFPKPGILFKDITPVMTSPAAYRATIDLFAERYSVVRPDLFVAIESRGFLFGGPLALELGVPLQLVRKAGKLPRATIEETYALEYGHSTLQVHRDEIPKGARVVILDDLLATGGTALAAARLVERQGGEVAEFGFLIELLALGGRAKIVPYSCHAVLSI
ncbi:MAG: adenine phosphoribosyltransferase [Deltaproteobacteria bacterium]|nr:adenine phosphoribosyltransferase [Deltaproteobacteria bacterium]